jgi:hypothetical protein
MESEEGKGELASRVTQHLRLSSRHRSVSPQSHRYPLPVVNSAAPVAIPPPEAWRNLPPPPVTVATGSISIPPLNSQGVVHSPRPFLSPKQSFSVDPLTHHSLPKSERVEELERMAAEVDAQNTDLSGDIPKATSAPLHRPAYVNKTLPGPPVPTGRDKSPIPSVEARTRVDTAFFDPPSEPVPSHQAPPTPTLTAVTPVRLHRSELNGLGQAESGLDALERKLLAEVGTKKLDLRQRRLDARAVLPITIPAPSRAIDPPNDSAISSLTLAHHDPDSDERTHKAGNSNSSRDAKDASQRGRMASVKKRGEPSGRGKAGSDRHLEKSKKERKVGKKERNGDGEGRRHRQAAKGRVAAWLGGIDPHVPPLDAPPPLSPNLDPAIDAIQSVSGTDLTALKAVDIHEMDVSSAPNPRSSGFVPIESFKREGHRAPEAENPGKSPATALPFWTPHKSDGQVSDQSTKSTPKAGPVNGQVELPLPQHSPPVSRKVAERLRFPPPSHPDVKYDVRSARGGRGGKVTAVASIWASGAAQPNNDGAAKPSDPVQKSLAVPPQRPTSKSPLSDRPASSQQPKLLDLPGRRRPVIKSSSVPIISSSHATPTLSSTASLARPSPTTAVKSVKVPPTISETYSEVGKVRPASAKIHTDRPPPPGDLAFGQARLRDLIKKYQGQAT